MNRSHLPPDDLERDPVWSLLARSPAPRAGSRFADDVLRAVRVAGSARVPWWRQLLAPWTLGGLASAAAAVALALWLWQPPPAAPGAGGGTVAVNREGFSDQQQALAEEEMLVAAADHLSEFSDAELVVLLGF